MLYFKNVTYKVNDKLIINNVSFVINDFDIVLLVGESGSGKSTIFNLAFLNISPNSGNIYFNNKDLNLLSSNKKDYYKKYEVSCMLQKDDLFDELTVIDNLLLFYQLDDINKLLKEAKMSMYKDRLVSSLSLGERQRIYVIKCLLKDSQMILADEVTSALDSINAKKVIELILNLSNDKTIVFISHDIKLFEGLVNKKLELKNHKITQIDLKENVKKSKIRKLKDSKSELAFFIKVGLSKIKVIPILIILVTFICFYIFFNFDNINTSLIKKSLSKYINNDVVEILDINKELLDSNDVIKIDNNIFKDVTINIDGTFLNNVTFTPYNSKDESILLVNNLLTSKYEIDDFIKSYIKSEYFYFINSIDKVNEANMYSISTIYYDINYFKNIKSANPDYKYYLVGYDFLLNDDRFTNNPMFNEKLDKDKPYLSSNSYFDYLTYSVIFEAIKGIIDYYFLLVFIYGIISLSIINFSSIYKDRKLIGIYKSNGYKDLNIITSYLISYIVYFLLLLILSFLDGFIKPFLLTIIISVFALLTAYLLVKRVSINELLKGDNLC